jgi:hypothetical protein
MKYLNENSVNERVVDCVLNNMKFTNKMYQMCSSQYNVCRKTNSPVYQLKLITVKRSGNEIHS